VKGWDSERATTTLIWVVLKRWPKPLWPQMRQAKPRTGALAKRNETFVSLQRVRLNEGEQ
jgi:hypothetical protein